MNTVVQSSPRTSIVRGTPRVSRAKTLIAALLATLALAGAGQAATAGPASAQKMSTVQCSVWWVLAKGANAEGNFHLGDFYYNIYWLCAYGS